MVLELLSKWDDNKVLKTQTTGGGVGGGPPTAHPKLGVRGALAPQNQVQVVKYETYLG